MNADDFLIIVWSIGLFGLLLTGWTAGFRTRRLFPNHCDVPEVRTVLQVGTSTLVTLTALVLGLLVTSAKASFDLAEADVTRYGTEVVKVDHLLRQYGSEAELIRTELTRYTEANLAQLRSAAPFESAAGRILDEVEDKVRRLHPDDDLHRRLQLDALSRVAEVVQRRWQLVADRGRAPSITLHAVLVFWITATFFAFGLAARPNAMVALIMSVCGLAVACAWFIIQEMDTPFSGLIAVSDQSLRTALTILNSSDGS